MILSEEHQMIRASVRDFASEKLWPTAGMRDETYAFPHEELAMAAELGLLGLTVPTKWNGAGLDYLAAAIAIEELAAGDGAFSTIVSVHNSVGCGPILAFGTPAQKDNYLMKLAAGEYLASFCLTEPQVGSEAGAIKTRAVKDDDSYVLNGAKQFITNGKNSKLAIVIAVTDPAKGKKGLSAFIVPTNTPGYTVARVEKKLGQAASDTCAIVLDDCRIPAANLLGQEGEGYKVALASLESGRIGIAAQALGMARSAYECALRYSKERITFGKPIFEHQAVNFRLADMATQLEAARQLIWHAACLKDAGQPCLKEASMAKLFASEMAERVCSDAIQVHGGYGYLCDFPLERIYRDVRVCQIYEGTSDIQRIVIGRAIGDEV
ncbi:acyl-CoA dehydrogenase family protein [Chitinimonas sp. BJB300]|uniref:acyl-CoA dehydrogenase family protein n=1 Tax=Chitinimonas sp. BJB300 TaxID=1559339 RepID=UPI000C0D10B0|nr:acyl-CoA dehydrogenase family protein [Chitinimonas sp. BJB300]PHV13218.1 acyl-CoA dehydrogenase [Chitinimonas sp. BJB300]TSJ89611.1 acyl-CoA dehydrogenase [Chitinimonas sp. BJB300]